MRHRRQDNALRDDCKEALNNSSNDQTKQKIKANPNMAFAIALFSLVLVSLVMFVQQKNIKPSQHSPFIQNAAVMHTTKSEITHSSFVECQIKANPLIFASGDNFIQITLQHDVAPLASEAFLDLVNANYYDGVFIFRVLKGFIAQWGFRPQWDKSILEPKKRTEIADTVIEGRSLSNIRGTIAFAGGSTVQVFINLGDNRRLDNEGQRPFGTITTSGMAVADNLYAGHKDGEGQIVTIQNGEDAVKEKFPKMAQIEKCRVVKEFTKHPIQEV